ncbi:MAG: ABC transporter substrate-binding protein [Pseudonocardia sp.]
MDVSDALVNAGLGRRQLLSGAATLLLLTACSRAIPGVAAPEPPSRELVTDQGVVEVPLAPGRVAALDQHSVLTLLDLGIRPVATIGGLGTHLLPAHADIYQELPKVGDGRVDIQALAAVEPDLIIGSAAESTVEHGLADYQAIAPTVLLGGATGTTGWQTWATQVADAVGKRAELDQLAAQYQGRIAQLRAAFTGQLSGPSWAMVRAEGIGTWSMTPPSVSGGVVLHDLGARFAQPAADPATAGVPLSYSDLSLLDGANIILWQQNVDGATSEGMGALLDHPLWERIPAVAGTGDRPIRNYVATHFGAGLALLGELEPILARIEMPR